MFSPRVSVSCKSDVYEMPTDFRNSSPVGIPSWIMKYDDKSNSVSPTELIITVGFIKQWVLLCGIVSFLSPMMTLRLTILYRRN